MLRWLVAFILINVPISITTEKVEAQPASLRPTNVTNATAWYTSCRLGTSSIGSNVRLEWTTPSTWNGTAHGFLVKAMARQSTSTTTFSFVLPPGDTISPSATSATFTTIDGRIDEISDLRDPPVAGNPQYWGLWVQAFNTRTSGGVRAGSFTPTLTEHTSARIVPRHGNASEIAAPPAPTATHNGTSVTVSWDGATTQHGTYWTRDDLQGDHSTAKSGWPFKLERQVLVGGEWGAYTGDPSTFQAGAWHSFPASQTTSTPFTDTNVEAANSYRYRLAYRSNCAIQGTFSGPGTVATGTTTTAVPPAPTGLAESSKTHNSVTLAWTAPTANPAVTSYKLYYGQDSIRATPQTASPTSSPHTVTGLTAETEYAFAIAAINSEGEGALSDTIRVTTAAAPATEPDPPTLSTVIQRSTATSADLTITQPADDGGADVISIKVYYTSDGGTPTKGSTSQTFSDLSDNTYSVTGLSPGTTYKFRATAINSVGESALSTAEATVQTLRRKPDAPTMSPTTESSTTSVMLTIMEPTGAGTGGAALDSLKVYYRMLPGGTFPARGTASSEAGVEVFATIATDDQYEITGLAPNTEYEFQATVANSGAGGGESELSGTATGTTLPGAPTVTGTAKVAEIDLTITGNSSNGTTESITAVNIYHKSSGSYPDTPTLTLSPASDNMYTLTGLLASTTYDVKVSMSNSTGEGPSAEVTGLATSAAAAPSTVTSPSKTPRSVRIRFTEVEHATGYQLRWREGDSGAWSSELTVDDDPNSDTHRQYDVGGLSHSTQYQFQVRALYSTTVQSDWTPTTPVAVTTDSPDVEEPDPPTGVTATLTNSDSVTLEWVAPTNAGQNATLAGFHVQGSMTQVFADYPPSGTGTWHTGPGATTLTAVHPDLTPGHLWYYRVRAHNTPHSKNGGWSELAQIRIPGGQPGKISPVNLTVQGSQQIEISWSAPSAGTFSIGAYEVQWSSQPVPDPNNASHWTSLPTNDQTTRIHSGLTAGQKYSYRVRAYSSVVEVGAGEWSDIVSETTENVVTGTVPSVIRNLTVATRGSDLDFAWDAPTSGDTPFTYEWQRHTGTDWETPGVTGIVETMHSYGGAPIGQERRYRVRAVNNIGPGAWTEIRATRQATPGKPTDLAASRTGTNITLNWTASSGGVTGYSIRVRIGNVTNWTVLRESTGNTNTTFVHTGTSEATRYEYEVAGVNQAGSSDWSEPAVVNPIATPTAPANLQATRSGTDITLTWSAPQQGTPTGYRIQRAEGATGAFTTIVSNTGNTNTTYVDRNRSTTVVYRYQVAAISGGGVSGYSNVVDLGLGNVPAQPTRLTATRAGTDINLEWTAPAGAISGYEIQVAEGDGAASWTTIVSNETATSYTHQNTNPETRYRYRVAARNVAGLGSWSAVVNVAVPTVAPGKVPGLRVGRQHPDMVLTWGAPPGPISGYKVEVRRDGGAWEVLTANTASTSTTYRHLNVLRAVQYTYRVSAINAAGTGPPSDPADSPVDLAAPSAPPGVRAIREHPQVRIDWDVPLDDGGLLITGYRIEYAVGNSNWATLVESVPHNSYIHQPTERAVRYRYRIYAINSHGVSPPSQPVEVRPNLTRPSPPRDVRATITEGNEIEISWVEPADDGGSPITGYQIQYREATRTAWLTLIEDTREPDQRSHVHPNVERGTEYEYRVAAINSHGLGDWSHITNAVTDDVPGPPRLAGAGQESKIELQWDPPVRTGGEPVVSYRLEVSEDYGLTWITLAEVGEHVRGYTHDQLGPGVRRTYRVRARNSLGEGAYSNVVTLTTKLVKASAPRDLQARALGQDVELVWLEPYLLGGSRIINYRIEISIDSRRWELVTTGATGNRYVVTGLDPDVERFFRIAVVTEAGVGEFSGAVKVKTEPTVPQPPNVVTALALNSTTISIAWNPPRDTGGRFTSLIGYRIEVYQGAEWIVLRSNTRSLETQYTHSGLKPGTEYHYRIRALNRVGVSPPSETVKARTIAVIPGPPTGVTVHAEGSDRLRVRWNPPRYDGGGPITGYQIEASKDGTWKILEPNTRTPRLDYLHTGLQPAQKWSYRISAINEAGLGEPSIVATGETHPIVPDPPTGLRAEADGDKIELRWKAPDYTGGLDVIGYRIEASRDRASYQMLVRNSGHPGTTFTHEDLPPASTWYYRVYAINEQGISRASQQASATTEAVEPGAPASVTATSPDPETVVLEWDKPSETGGAPITGHRIQFSEDEGVSWTELEHNTNSDERRYVHRNRKPATVYWYRVFAINRIGVGPASPSVSVRTQAEVPDPPLNLTATDIAPDVIQLAWDPPEYDGGAEIEHYRIEHTIHPEEDWEILAESERSEWMHEGLTPGETHYYRVRAVNSAGISKPSNMAEAKTDDTADRIERLNRTVLPRFASTVASGVIKSISDRMDAIAHNRGGHRRIGMPTEQGGLGAMLNGASVSRPVGVRVSAWGSAERVKMSNVTDSMRWEGEALGIYTGSDIEVGNGLFLGLSGSHSTGSYDIVDFAWDEELEADYGLGMTTITPYIGWLPKQNVSAWTSGSYSFGEIKLEQGPTDFATSRMTMMMGAGGLIGRLVSGQSGGLSLRAEGWVARLDVRQAEDFNPVVLDLRRVRTLLEWQRSSIMNGDHEFMLTANAGLRHDFHAELTNHTGFEFGGGVGYTSPGRRLRITGTTRMLVTTDSEYSEWGMGGGLYLDPSPRGGLSIRAEPSYGSSRSGVEQLWSNGVPSMLSNERQLLTPVSVEYRKSGGMAPYVRVASNQLVLGMTLRGVAVEGNGAEGNRGLALRGSWAF